MSEANGVTLQAFVDESGTRNQDECLVLAGFISPSQRWAAFPDEWRACLETTPSIPYFKMRHAIGTPSGVFWHWKREDVHVKVRDLVGVIKRHVETAIHCTMPIALFDEIIGREMGGLLRNPYVHSMADDVRFSLEELRELRAVWDSTVKKRPFPQSG